MIAIPSANPFARRWGVFVRERFWSLSHLLLILLFFSSNAAVAVASCRLSLSIGVRDILSIIILWFAFLHLRLLDEIKDYDRDRTLHPERPLARGIVTVAEAKGVATAVILLQLLFASLIGWAAFFASSLMAIFSLVMYKEFYQGPRLRSRPVLYAMAHTSVACWMGLFIFSAVTGHPVWQIPEGSTLFLLASWMLFAAFEFSRKTFGKEEEKGRVDSYSRIWSPFGAAVRLVLALTVAVCVAFRLGHLFNATPLFFRGMGLLFAVTLLTASLYAFSPNRVWAKGLRTVSSLFIVLYTVMVTFLIRGD